ncbi:hypothetical protein [Salinimicrobium gaetbulicola]|uniref:Outer membrane protein with beta-barrel domain n=1 Tax=Salinimicrobium gaetbulicola TaxID=999702 RepID=A0ABW3IBU6_9FLAO
MKKLLLVGILAIFGLNPFYGQNNFNVGIQGGIPLGDIEDFSSFELGVDLAYRFTFVEIVEVGPLIGYSHFFGKDDFDDLSYLPIAASGRLGLPQSFFAGFDLGYAIALEDNVDGGLYYRPQVGYQFPTFGIVLSYAGIASDGFDVGALTFGVEFKW